MGDEKFEQVSVMIERKQELAMLSRKKGIKIASLVRSWIYEKLDAELSAQ